MQNALVGMSNGLLEPELRFFVVNATDRSKIPPSVVIPADGVVQILAISEKKNPSSGSKPN